MSAVCGRIFGGRLSAARGHLSAVGRLLFGRRLSSVFCSAVVGPPSVVMLLQSAVPFPKKIIQQTGI